MEKRRNCSSGAISPLFHIILYNIFLTSGVKLHIHLLNVVVQFIVFLTLSTLICRSMDISKCFSESLGIRDNGSRLYLDSAHRILSSLFDYPLMSLKGIDRMTNSVDPDQTAPYRSSLIWDYSVCANLLFRIFNINMVAQIFFLKKTQSSRCSRLSLSRSRKNALKNFEISVPRHIRFVELRKKK